MMNTRISFADLLKKGTEKEQARAEVTQRISHSPEEKEATPPTPLTLPTQATPRTTPTKRTAPTPPTHKLIQPIAPEKDFAKVANSIVREAVAQGIFIGKSKQIYDFLYLQTRGAVQPRRSIRITKLLLMKGANIGSERTLLKNINHLKITNLIKITEFDGQHGGNEYEVFLPEETQATPPTPPQPRYSLQKVGGVPPVESGVGGVAQVYENKDSYSDAKTNIKTNTIDDDNAYARMNEKLNAACERITGKKSSANDSEKWAKLAELLIQEMDNAAKRTGTISSIPAFLTEIVRRQFFIAHRQEQSVGSRDHSDNYSSNKSSVGKSDEKEFTVAPLNKQGREQALSELKEFASEEFLADFQKWYTFEDWEWLTGQLKSAS